MSIKAGIYMIYSLSDSNNVIDLDDFGTANGTPIFSYPKNSGANQMWFVTPVLANQGLQTGKYVFVNVSSGNFMSTVQTSGSLQPPFKTLQSYTTADYWTITAGTQSGAYYINSVSVPDRVLDVSGASTAPRTPILLQTVNEPRTANQQWTFTKVD